MRAILVFYIYYEVSKGGLGLEETTALAIMSIYGSLVYMSGIIGGASILLGLILFMVAPKIQTFMKGVR